MTAQTRDAGLLRWLTRAIVCVLALLLLEASPKAAALNEVLSESAELTGPQLKLLALDGQASRAVQLSTSLSINVTGLLARATLKQQFRNDSAEWVEAEYLLPLPHDAAVHRMDLLLGERRIKGEIREREEARQVYDTARTAGKRSALLEQQRPHLFTTRVANVPPGEEISIHVEMVLPVAYVDGEFSLRFPTTVTAPYVPGVPQPVGVERESWLPLAGSGWALPTTQVPDAPLITALQRLPSDSPTAPANPLSIDVSLSPGIPLAQVDALYHDIRIERSGNDYQLQLQNAVTEMDRDFVLRWRPQASAQPQAAVFRERFEGEEYAMLMMLPPTDPSRTERLPRELILVVDVSGSMQGDPIRQAKASALQAIAGLDARDSINVIAFSNQFVQLFPVARRANASTLALAKAFVDRLDAAGGTEMLPALDAALRMPGLDSWGENASGADSPVEGVPAESHRALRQLVFITDGAVANESEMLDLLERKRGDARLFTVGIGSAPNSYFMHRAAEVGRGEAVFIGRSAEVESELGALFRRIQAPMAAALEVTWPAQVEAFPSPIPDLYQGQALQQFARLGNLEVDGVIRISGELNGKVWERQMRLPASSAAEGVANAWARKKIEASLLSLHRGVPRESVRAQVLPLALRFSLLSPFTSFVAVEAEPVRPMDAVVNGEKVPNVKPAGQAVQRFALAQGATSGPVKLYLGLFAAFIALIAFALSRPEPL
ncbi:MAG: marine proteobacterial sortase target protein [Congregibacter sp.]